MARDIWFQIFGAAEEKACRSNSVFIQEHSEEIGHGADDWSGMAVGN